MTSLGVGRGAGSTDLVVVGAGIVGLAHAAHAVSRGASVTVIERDVRAVGASVRNFGHGCITGQTGAALQYGMAARTDWLRLAKEAGFWLSDAGTVVVARADDEYAVLEDFAAARDGDVVLLDAAAVRSRSSLADPIVGGAWLPLDLRVDPREAVASIATWLGEQGVTFHWDTHVLSTGGGTVETNRGPIRAERTVVAVGHDVDRIYPDIAEQAGLQRCLLHMIKIANPTRRTIEPAVLTGFSLLRYPGFRVSPSLAAVAQRLQDSDGDAVVAGLNLMFTQRPDGDLVIGDTHEYAKTHSPFQDESRDELLLRHAARLFGTTDLAVRQRWLGVYASAPDPFLTSAPSPDVRVVSVTSGIGMTTAFGLAASVIDDLLT